jgi:hypothetical protein
VLQAVVLFSVAALAATNASMADSWALTSPTIAHPPTPSALLKALANFLLAFETHAGSSATAFFTAFE